MADTTSDPPTEAQSETSEESASVEECLSKANTYKASGNDFYKQAKFSEAGEAYESGITWLKKIHDPSASHKELLSILYSNLCATQIEASNFSGARVSADEAIANNKDNAKAYYRRAQALFSVGSFEEALADCSHLLELNKNDPNVNNLVRKINLKLKESKQQQKKVGECNFQAFGGLFDKVGGLYDDRQREMQNKKQKKYEDYLKSQRGRRAQAAEKGEEEMDFEAWEKFDEAEEAKKEEERTQKAKEEEGGKKKAADDTPEFDEEDEKIMNETKKMGRRAARAGYCYFGKKKDEPAKQAGEVKPVLRQSASTPSVLGNDAQAQASKRAISSWNAQGTTYEEKGEPG